MSNYRDELAGQDEREAEVEFNFMHLLHRMSLSLSVLPAFLVVGLLCAVLAFAVSTKKYTAMMTVEQSQADPSQMSSSSSGGSGLLSMALPFLTGSANNNLSTYQYLLTYRNVADELFQDPKILKGVFQDKYDAEKHVFVEPNNPIEWARASWRLLQGRPAWRPKQPDDLLEYINKNVSVDIDKVHNVVEISFLHQDPAFAVYFLQKLSSIADGELRVGDRITALHQIEYLNKALRSVVIADTRDSMIATLSNLQKQLMFIDTTQYYSFEMVNIPEASTDTTSPSLPLYIFLSVVFFGLVWTVLAYRYEMRLGDFSRWIKGNHLSRQGWRLPSDRGIHS